MRSAAFPTCRPADAAAFTDDAGAALDLDPSDPRSAAPPSTGCGG